MRQIPPTALVLGLAGLIPFLWGMATILSPELATWGQRMIGARFVGPYVQLFYGSLILCFMSGVLWGFATMATGALGACGYGVSVLPVLWVLFVGGEGAGSTALFLTIGFAGLLILDWYFWQARLAPPWWMHLRVLLTALVVASFLPMIL
ncbi:MAG: DUF3429 domain-containing protein [Rubellimicrobium sp.]|nr:DUF3429 domain-containing protein [Rubellimicrobium sp.]